MSDKDVERVARRLARQEMQIDGLMRTQQVARTLVGGVTVEDALVRAGDTADRVGGIGGDVARLDDGKVLDAWDAAQRVPTADDYLEDLAQRQDEVADLASGLDGWRDERYDIDEFDSVEQEGLRADLEQAGRELEEARVELGDRLADLGTDLTAADGRITEAKNRADTAFGKAETAETTAGAAQTAAISAATAASNAQSTADTARSEATQKAADAEAAAKAFATAEAEAAEAAAKAAAAADALTKANAARDAAVGTAAGDATAKANAATAAAAVDALAKADAAEAAAKAAAAADATTKANAARDAAIGVANTAQARADSAHSLAGTAESNAQAALTMAGTKSRVTYSTTVPSGTANAGDIHRRLPTAAEITAGAAAGDIMQEWRSQGSTTWQEVKVSSTAIANLDVGKLTVQTGIISDLVAQHIAGRTATFQTVNASNIFVTGTAAIHAAVVEKLWADVVKAKMLTVTEKIIANDIFAAGVVGAAALAADAIDGKKITGVEIIGGSFLGNTFVGGTFTGGTFELRSAASGTVYNAEGFESALGGWTGSRSTAQKRTGSYSLLANTVSGEKLTRRTAAAPTAPLLKVSAWVYSSSARNDHGIEIIHGSDWGVLRYPFWSLPAGQWVKIERSFTPVSSEPLTIGFYGSGTSNLYVDDIEILAMSELDERVAIERNSAGRALLVASSNASTKRTELTNDTVSLYDGETSVMELGRFGGAGAVRSKTGIYVIAPLTVFDGPVSFQDDSEWANVTVPGATGTCRWRRVAGVIYLSADITFATAIPVNGTFSFSIPSAAGPQLSFPLNSQVHGSYPAEGNVEPSGAVAVRNLHTAASTRFKLAGCWPDKTR